MNTKELQLGIKELAPWYHSILMPCGDGDSIMTPGEPYGEAWENVRTVRNLIDYVGKNVLDLATFDGMWAFEAEDLGSSQVVAVDCMWRLNPLFCARARQSKAIFLLNVPMHELYHRLDSLFASKEQWQNESNRPFFSSPKFDIVQHLGLFYHLRDPLFSLLQTRSVMKDGGTLLMETAYLAEEERPMMIFNSLHTPQIYNDITTWWAPSIECLSQVLKSSCFELQTFSTSGLDPTKNIGRLCLIAKATRIEDCPTNLIQELRNRYRTPGFEL